MSRAEAVWNEQLGLAHGDIRWYDYDFHCRALGLPAIAFEAHERSKHALRAIPDSVETVRLLVDSGYRFGVATDAVGWVLRFKLSYFGFPEPSVVLTSTSQQSVKAQPEYWETVGRISREGAVWFIDNRFRNIDSATRAVASVNGLWFESEEHVLRMPVFRSLDDISRRTRRNDIARVDSLRDLQRILLPNRGHIVL